MDFKGNYRIEAVYFDKLKRNIKEAKRLLESGAAEEARFLLEDSVDVDGAVLLLYRNLGELWADLADKLEETKKALQLLDEKTEKYHDELNEKIDEINNYIMSLIRALEERVTDLETTVADHETRIGNLEDCCEDVQEALANKQDKLTAGQNITIDENNVISAAGGSDLFIVNLSYDSNTTTYTKDKTFAEMQTAYNAGKIVVLIVRYTDSGDNYFETYIPQTNTPDSNFYFVKVSGEYSLGSTPQNVLKQPRLSVWSDESISDATIDIFYAPNRYNVSETVSGNVHTLNKTASDIYAAVNYGGTVLIQIYRSGSSGDPERDQVIYVGYTGSQYASRVYTIKTLTKTYTAVGASTNPSYTET